MISMSQRKTTAIVMAAGRGSRMKAGINKVYLHLGGKPVVAYSLEAFEKSDIDDVIIVVSAGDQELVENEIVKAYGLTKVRKVIAGGSERFESVYKGVCACQGNEDNHYIFIHDGARPFIRPDQINQCIEAVVKYKACAMAVPVKDTIRVIDENGFSKISLNRNELWQMQTPQCFVLSEAKAAFESMIKSGDRDITDDVMVLERYGNRHSKMIECSYDNIKLTTPEDMIIGESILKKYRMGDKE